MSTIEKAKKLTIVLNDKELYRAIKHAAVEQDRPMREIIIEALREWLERQEEQEDLAAIAEVEGEPTVPWEQVKAEMREARAKRGG